MGILISLFQYFLPNRVSRKRSRARRERRLRLGTDTDSSGFSSGESDGENRDWSPERNRRSHDRPPRWYRESTPFSPSDRGRPPFSPSGIDSYHPSGRSNMTCSGDGFFTRHKERIPEPFHGSKTDLNDYLATFDMTAKWNGWSYTEKGTNLSMSLRGNAQQILQDLTADEREDYEVIVNALKRRFEPDERESQRRLEFRNRLKNKSETLTEYGYLLNRLARKAYPNMATEARDILVVDQFILGLPGKDIRGHVQFHHPQNIHEAIALSSEYESFEKSFEGRKPENHEKPIRNLRQEERKDELFQMVKEMRDELNQMKSSRNGNQGPERRDTRYCYNCGDKSHFARSCPQPWKPDGRAFYQLQQAN